VEILGELARDHILLGKDNVVFTPHIAFFSQEALERILDMTSLNIKKFIDSEESNIIV